MQPARWSIKNQRAAQPIPIPDIHRGIGIGVRLVSAPCADVGMFATFVDRPAMMAGLAGVVRTHRIHRHASSHCLVARKRLELIKRPIVPVLSGIRFGIFALLRRCPNARQVLKPDPGSAAQRQSNQLLAHHVVEMCDDAMLLVLQLFDSAVLPHGLERLSALGKYPAHMADLLRLPECDRPIGRCRHHRDVLPSVHADPAAS